MPRILTTTQSNPVSLVDTEGQPYPIAPDGDVGPGPSDILAFVSVREFGAVGDGVHDDTASIQAACNVTALSGQAVWFPQGNWTVTATIVEPDGLIAWCDASALFTCNVPGALATDAAFAARVPVAIGAPTTLSGTPAAFASVLPLTAIPAGTAAGSVLQVTGTAYVAYYIVEKVVGLNVTIDRPSQWPMAAGDAVQRVDALPPCIHWYGNGARMTGTCVLFFFGAAWNSSIRGMRFSGIVGGHADAVAGFHQGSFNCELEGNWADAFGAIAGFNAGFGIVGGEQCVQRRNVMLNGGATCAAFKCDDCRTTSTLDNYGAGSNIGLSYGSDFGTLANANANCVAAGNRFVGCATGLQLANGSSGNVFEGNSYVGSTGVGIRIFGGGGMTGNVFVGEQVLDAGGVGIELDAGGAIGTTFVDCVVRNSSGTSDVLIEDEFVWHGGLVVQSAAALGVQFNAATGVVGVMRDVHVQSLTTGAAATAIKNTGGRLTLSGLVELGHANDVGVWTASAGAGTAVTSESDLTIEPVGGVGGTIANFVQAGQTLRIGPNVNADATATPTDLAVGAFCNRGTFTSAIGAKAVAFPDLVSTDDVTVMPVGLPSGVGYLSAVTTGTGFSWTDTTPSNYAYTIL